MAYITNAEVMQYATNELQRRKAGLIQALRANCSCPWSQQELEAKSLTELTKLAAIAGMVTNNQLETYDPPKVLLGEPWK